ncbi:hypothetical protein D3C84_1124450 [compost metagenome]
MPLHAVELAVSVFVVVVEPSGFGVVLTLETISMPLYCGALLTQVYAPLTVPH